MPQKFIHLWSDWNPFNMKSFLLLIISTTFICNVIANDELKNVAIQMLNQENFEPAEVDSKLKTVETCGGIQTVLFGKIAVDETNTTLNCEWTIVAPKGYVVGLAIDSFNFIAAGDLTLTDFNIDETMATLNAVTSHSTDIYVTKSDVLVVTMNRMSMENTFTVYWAILPSATFCCGAVSVTSFDPDFSLAAQGIYVIEPSIIIFTEGEY